MWYHDHMVAGKAGFNGLQQLWPYSSQQKEGNAKTLFAIHGKAAGMPLWIAFCWANSPNCSFPLFHSSLSTLFVSLHFIRPGEDRSESRWANSPEKKAAFLLHSQESWHLDSWLQAVKETAQFMSGCWFNCFKLGRLVTLITSILWNWLPWIKS